MNIEVTTLCHLRRDDCILMMHRIKKKNDINKDKYIGVGGHTEHGESPEECIKREIFEETGCIANSVILRGIITFVIDDLDEYTFLYDCTDFSGEPKNDCTEGALEWIPLEKIPTLPIWEGDKIMFRLLEERQDVFSLKLIYIHDELTGAALDGVPLAL